MARRIMRRFSATIFLLAVLAATRSAPLQAVDCWGFVLYCQVQGMGNQFQYACSPEITCDLIEDCILEAGCFGACIPQPPSQYGGPWGVGQCPS